jgi:hypothetical protein
MPYDQSVRRYCRECEYIQFWHESLKPAEKHGKCPYCGNALVKFERLSDGEQETARFQAWCRVLRRKGLHGFSPGGAAQRLGCHRSMIDKLAERGLLEKSVYDRDGHFVVYISERSIRRAKEAKERSGKWTKAEQGDLL